MNQVAVEWERVPGATTLYVFFGGMAAGIVIPPFEFYRAASILDQHKLFLRDFGQCWYHAGLVDASHDLRSTAVWLRDRIDILAPRRTVFVGNSMGGYAALLFASLLGAGDVVAFAPQTYLSPWLRWRHGDRRWPHQIRHAWRQSLPGNACWNLRPLLAACAGRVRAEVHVSPADHLDMTHALHIRDVAGVRVHEHSQGGHDLVRCLRDRGELAAIMAGRPG